MQHRFLLSFGLCAVLAACGTDNATTPGPDTTPAGQDSGGNTDSSDDTGAQADGTTSDAGGSDGSATDTTAGGDTSESDVAVPDAGNSDTAGADTGTSDTETPDTGTPDTSAPDTETPDTSAPDTATPDAGPLDKVTEHTVACKNDGDCTIPCATGTCVDSKCTYDVGGGCLVPMAGDKVACYPAGAKSATAACLACNPDITKSGLTSATELLGFEDPSEGWTSTDISGSGMKWTLVDKRKTGGKTSLYLGDTKSFVYANDKHVKASMTTPAMAVPKHDGVKPSLDFWLYLDTEESKGYDTLQVAVVEAGSKDKPTELWHSDSIGGTTHKVWELQSVSLDKWAGKKVQFVFTFDTLDGFVNAFEGAYIDELTVRTGCCGGASDCDDGNACSTDACAATATSKGLPVCGYTTKKECCSSSADCDDGKPCTLDLCSGPGGSCSHNAKPGCCMKTEDCDDKDSCTIDHCPKAGASCLHSNTCCKADSECVSEDSCLVGKCAGGDCAFTSTCCSLDAECDDFNPCTLDTCDQGKCIHSPSKAPGCCAVEPVVYEFDSGMEGWTSDKALSNKLVWHQGKYVSKAGDPQNNAGVMKFGIPGQDTFSNLTGSNYLYVTSPEIELPPGQQYTLEIKYKFELDYKTTSNYIYQYYLVDGKQITSYYNYSKQIYYYKNHSTTNWEVWQKDISAFAGRKFKIKLRGRIYGYSSKKQSGQGTVIDYVKIKTSCNAKKCSGSVDCTPTSTSCQGGLGICNEGACAYVEGCCKSSSDCKSPTLCSTGTCSGGKCKFSEKANCCMGPGDCDDGNPCTTDGCPGPGKDCTHTPIPGCCLSSGECDDKKTCTQDTCLNNKCTHQDICCKSDLECDDKDDKCTTDKCGSDGFCKYTATGAAGCCEPNLFVNDFSSSLKNMTIKNSAGATKGWQLWQNATISKSPKGVLYYGSPAQKNYNFGANNGTAVTPEVSLPAGKVTTLSLALYMATESGTSYDKLYIYLIDANGKKNQLWYKGSKGFKTNSWLDLKFDLSKWKGQKVKIEFNFNTSDSVANSTLGVLVDDLKLLVKCD